MEQLSSFLPMPLGLFTLYSVVVFLFLLQTFPTNKLIKNMESFTPLLTLLTYLFVLSSMLMSNKVSILNNLFVGEAFFLSVTNFLNLTVMLFFTLYRLNHYIRSQNEISIKELLLEVLTLFLLIGIISADSLIVFLLLVPALLFLLMLIPNILQNTMNGKVVKSPIVFYIVTFCICSGLIGQFSHKFGLTYFNEINFLFNNNLLKTSLKSLFYLIWPIGLIVSFIFLAIPYLGFVKKEYQKAEKLNSILFFRWLPHFVGWLLFIKWSLSLTASAGLIKGEWSFITWVEKAHIPHYILLFTLLAQLYLFYRTRTLKGLIAAIFLSPLILSGMGLFTGSFEGRVLTFGCITLLSISFILLSNIVQDVSLSGEYGLLNRKTKPFYFKDLNFHGLGFLSVVGILLPFGNYPVYKLSKLLVVTEFKSSFNNYFIYTLMILLGLVTVACLLRVIKVYEDIHRAYFSSADTKYKNSISYLWDRLLLLLLVILGVYPSYLHNFFSNLLEG